ncbi:hypothetical protein FRC10_008608 [Ceratobasidium sp. 414]|nr:hypothetical protein FRC10_008608 [Ceratobasidium sp. 414]
MWILQAGSASGVTTGSVWALHDTAAEDLQPVGHLQALEPDVSSTALTKLRAGSSNPSTSMLPKRSGIDRMYARQFRPGVGQELRVYFSPEAKDLIFGHGLNKHPQDLVGATQYDACYTEHKTRGSADIAVDIYHRKSTPKSSKPGAGTEVTFTLLCSQVQAGRYGVETLGKRTPATRDKVEHVLFAAARWHWHLKRMNTSARSAPGVSLEFMKLGVNRGNCMVPIEGQENLINEGTADITVKEEDRYGIKVLNQSSDELYIRVLYFATNDFSIVDMFGHSKANGRPDPDIPQRGRRVIGDEADGGASLSFGLSQGDKFELGFVKVFWSTDPLELDDVPQESPFESDDHRESRAPIMTRSKRWGAELITLVQRHLIFTKPNFTSVSTHRLASASHDLLADGRCESCEKVADVSGLLNNPAFVSCAVR